MTTCLYKLNHSHEDRAGEDESTQRGKKTDAEARRHRWGSLSCLRASLVVLPGDYKSFSPVRIR
jgi:hypothetical protein